MKKPLPLPGLARAPHLRLVGASPVAAGGGPDSDPPPAPAAPAAAAPVRLPPAPAPIRALLEQLEREAA